MESIGTDVRDIEAKFKNAVTEENRKGEDAPAALKQFLEDAKPQIALLRDNYKLAQEAFAECAEFYGEMSAARSQPDSAAFFTRISTFVKHFEQALVSHFIIIYGWIFVTNIKGMEHKAYNWIL